MNGDGRNLDEPRGARRSSPDDAPAHAGGGEDTPDAAPASPPPDEAATPRAPASAWADAGAVAQLEEDGWEVIPSCAGDEGVLEARRERGERVETLHAARDGRLRYTLTRPVGEEGFRREGEGEEALRVVSRTYAEVTVTGSVGVGGIRHALRRAVRAARG